MTSNGTALADLDVSDGYIVGVDIRALNDSTKSYAAIPFPYNNVWVVEVYDVSTKAKITSGTFQAVVYYV